MTKDEVAAQIRFCEAEAYDYGKVGWAERAERHHNTADMLKALVEENELLKKDEFWTHVIKMRDLTIEASEARIAQLVEENERLLEHRSITADFVQHTTNALEAAEARAIAAESKAEAMRKALRDIQCIIGAGPNESVLKTISAIMLRAAEGISAHQGEG